MVSSRIVRPLLLAGCACAALHVSGARAQGVDYGTLEQLFGEPITTSATGKPQRASDVPADMVIISADDIRRSGADNIPDILQFVTGIDVRRYSFGDSQVAVRGYDQPLTPRLLVLVDGREVYNNFYGYEGWNTIPVQLGEIRQIEVVKGPNSALFGFNAVGGVVNIVTFDPLYDKTNEITVRGGTQGYGQGEAVATEHLGPTAGVRVSVGGWTSTGYSQPDAAGSPPLEHYGSFNLDTRWQITPSVLLSGSGGYTDTREPIGIPIEEVLPLAEHDSYGRGVVSAQTGIGVVTADFDRNQQLLNLVGSNINVRTVIAKLADLAQPDAADTVRVGLEFRSNTLTSLPQLDPGTVSYDNYAVNAMWDRRISSVFELTNAVRLDHLVLSQSGAIAVVTPGRSPQDYDRATITQPSFNSGLVAHVSAIDTLRLTLARGLQVPSLIDYGAQLELAPGVYAVGNPSLQPTAVWNAELGYTRGLPAFAAALESAVFFQRNTNLLASAGTGPIVPAGAIYATYSANFGSSNAVGFELGLRGARTDGIRWNASYRYETISQDTENFGLGDETKLAGGTPLSVVILGAGYSHGRWEVDVQGRYQTALTDYGRNPVGAVVAVPVPDYASFNARIAYRVTEYLTLAGIAEQFNQARVFEGAGSYVDRRWLASATVHF